MIYRMVCEACAKPPICVFDSGIGGLNLLYECMCRLPHENFAYFADNYRVPYGNMTKDELFGLTCGVFDKMQRLSPAAAVVACNTVTALCIDRLRERYPFKIIGIQPAVKPAAAEGECIVLATKATAESGAVEELVKRFGRDRTRVFQCRELAAYIENNIFSLDEKAVSDLLPNVKADEVVLGCTHYAYVKNFIKKRYGCKIFDGIIGTANHVAEIFGIESHYATTCRKINFFGGNTVKNRTILKFLIKEGADYFALKR